MLAIVNLQRADGSWMSADRVLAAVETHISSLVALTWRKQVAALSSSPTAQPTTVQETMVATCLALAVLEAECARQHAEWALIANKAEQWLKKQQAHQTPAVATDAGATDAGAADAGAADAGAADAGSVAMTTILTHFGITV